MFDFERLKSIRKEKGFTQDEMAEILGYASKSGYCELENGNVGISLEKAKKISETFDMTIEDIFLTTESK